MHMINGGQTNMSVETFTVLQLTDLHLTNRKSHDKEQEIVISALLADIEIMTQAGLKPDLVLFTGDLVNDAQLPGALSHRSFSRTGLEQGKPDGYRHDRNERCHQIRRNCAHWMSHTAEAQRNADGRSDRHPRECGASQRAWQGGGSTGAWSRHDATDASQTRLTRQASGPGRPKT